MVKLLGCAAEHVADLRVTTIQCTNRKMKI